MRTTPSISQNSIEECSWPLIRLVEPDRDHEEQADREHERDDDRPRPHAAGDLLALRRPVPRASPPSPRHPRARAPGRQLRVGGDVERANADRHRPAERHDAAHDRQAQHAVAPQRGGEGKRRDLDLALGGLLAGRSSSCSCSGVGLRTATAQCATPRIITPSSTACPPTGASRWAFSAPPSAPLSISTSTGVVAGAAASEVGIGPLGGLGLSAAAAPLTALATRRWKRSTRPPVSISFWRPV